MEIAQEFIAGWFAGKPMYVGESAASLHALNILPSILKKQ